MSNPTFAHQQFSTDPSNIPLGNSGEIELFGIFPVSLQQTVYIYGLETGGLSPSGI